MESYISVLKNSSLFQDMKGEEINNIMICLSARTAHYKKGQPIFLSGDVTSDMGMVLKGSVTLVKEDYWGNRSILNKNEAGEVFGEVYACLGSEPLLVSVIADTDTAVLFLNIQKVVHVCSSACQFHTQLVLNLLKEMARKAFVLTLKIQHTSKRSTRDKLLSYLSEAALHAESSAFTIPFNRQELADYLYVDRSAMSAELGRMRDEGILEFDRNQFRLIKRQTERDSYL